MNKKRKGWWWRMPLWLLFFCVWLVLAVITIPFALLEGRLCRIRFPKF